MTVDVGLATPGLPQAVASWHAVQTQLAASVVAELQRLWLTVDPFDLDGSWATIAPQLLQVVSAGQLAAAGGADAFLTACLAQLGIDGTAVASVVPAAFAGSAADGRSLAGALYSPVVTVKTATATGLLAEPAMQAGLAALVNIGTSQIADVGRQAAQVGMTARPAVTGYVRAVNAGGCARCLILAGRVYRYSAGFDRHPRCDCRNVPTNEQVAADLVTDPDEYMRAAPPAERERLLGKAGARALDDGANLNQLVNARRGVGPVKVYGRTVSATTEGTTSRGMYGRLQDDLQKVDGKRFKRSATPRLTPEAIYSVAESREEQLAMLRRFGYVTE